MAEFEKVKKSLAFDPEKTEKLYEDLVKLFAERRPTVGEILIAYGNLGYALGASIGGFSGEGPGVDELKELYYSNPGRLDIALMLQGLLITTWYDDWERNQLEKKGTKGETE
jgi:hypothetical protein